MVNVTVDTSTSQTPPLRPRITRTEYRVAAVGRSQSTAAVLSIPNELLPDNESRYSEVYRIQGELPGGLWLYHAVPVTIRLEGAEYVAVQPHLALHAFGETPVDAIMNLREELAEHYEHLEEMGDRLGPQLVKQREILRRLLSSPDA